MAARTKNDNNLTFLGIKLPWYLKDWVQGQADKKLVSLSDVVREAIIEKKERVEHGRL